jgi:hypothetical protein
MRCTAVEEAVVAMGRAAADGGKTRRIRRTERPTIP